MSRDVPYDENAICDGCGKKGAYDFVGDLVCDECLATPEGDAMGELIGEQSTGDVTRKDR